MREHLVADLDGLNRENTLTCHNVHAFDYTPPVRLVHVGWRPLQFDELHLGGCGEGEAYAPGAEVDDDGPGLLGLEVLDDPVPVLHRHTAHHRLALQGVGQTLDDVAMVGEHDDALVGLSDERAHRLDGRLHLGRRAELAQVGDGDEVLSTLSLQRRLDRLGVRVEPELGGDLAGPLLHVGDDVVLGLQVLLPDHRVRLDVGLGDLEGRQVWHHVELLPAHHAVGPQDRRLLSEILADHLGHVLAADHLHRVQRVLVAVLGERAGHRQAHPVDAVGDHLGGDPSVGAAVLDVVRLVDGDRAPRGALEGCEALLQGLVADDRPLGDTGGPGAGGACVHGGVGEGLADLLGPVHDDAGRAHDERRVGLHLVDARGGDQAFAEAHVVADEAAAGHGGDLGDVLDAGQLVRLQLHGQAGPQLEAGRRCERPRGVGGARVKGRRPPGQLELGEPLVETLHPELDSFDDPLVRVAVGVDDEVQLTAGLRCLGADDLLDAGHSLAPGGEAHRGVVEAPVVLVDLDHGGRGRWRWWVGCAEVECRLRRADVGRRADGAPSAGQVDGVGRHDLPAFQPGPQVHGRPERPRPQFGLPVPATSHGLGFGGVGVLMGRPHEHLPVLHPGEPRRGRLELVPLPRDVNGDSAVVPGDEGHGGELEGLRPVAGTPRRGEGTAQRLVLAAERRAQRAEDAVQVGEHRTGDRGRHGAHPVRSVAVVSMMGPRRSMRPSTSATARRSNTHGVWSDGRRR